MTRSSPSSAAVLLFSLSLSLSLVHQQCHAFYQQGIHQHLSQHRQFKQSVFTSSKRAANGESSASAATDASGTTTAASSALPFFATVFEKTNEKAGTTTVTTRLPLGTLFDSRDYIFECATNMRGYEWTVKEAEELLDDLSDAALGKLSFSPPSSSSATSNNDDMLDEEETATAVEDYELSQIVLVPMEWDQEKFGLGQKYDVHDGQQRLVTLCLILASLRESFRATASLEEDNTTITAQSKQQDKETAQELANMLFPRKVRKDDILRIQLRKRDGEMLTYILQETEDDQFSTPDNLRKKLSAHRKATKSGKSSAGGKNSLTNANRRILENYDRLLARVASLTREERLKLLDFMSMHVHLLVCVPDTASIARNIVMSQGKGMDNEPIDDFKGLVCFRYTNKENDMYKTFEKWDKLANTADLDNDSVGRDIVSAACLLRATANLRIKIRKNDQVYAMERWLREDLLSNPQREGTDFYMKHIEPASLALGRFRDLNVKKAFNFSGKAKGGKLGNMIAMRLTLLRFLTANVGAAREAEVVILELLLRAQGKSGKEEKGKAIKAMSLTELDGYLHHAERLTLWMALTKPSAIQRYQRCFAFLDAIDSSSLDTFSSISLEEQSILREELVCYEFGMSATGRKIAMALLQRLNAEILSENDEEVAASDTLDLHIEHVLPVKATKKLWGDDWPDQRDMDKWVHRLGNLVLLSEKAPLREAKKAFADKKKRYKAEMWPLTNSLAEKEVWSRDTMVGHMGLALNLMEKIWGL